MLWQTISQLEVGSSGDGVALTGRSPGIEAIAPVTKEATMIASSKETRTQAKRSRRAFLSIRKTIALYGISLVARCRRSSVYLVTMVTTIIITIINRNALTTAFASKTEFLLLGPA